MNQGDRGAFAASMTGEPAKTCREGLSAGGGIRARDFWTLMSSCQDLLERDEVRS